jgi:pSer/pThr/pTyr-binding forkhead associated (FHA) protein
MKHIFFTLTAFLILSLFPKATNSQGNSEILGQLFYGAVDIVDQGEDFIGLSIDAVWYASEINKIITTTGTLTQNTLNTDLWTYSSSPNDKLVLIFANKAVVNFKFAKIDGYVEGTEEDFKNSHEMDFTSEIPGMINLRIQSRIGRANERTEWIRTITGKSVLEETPVNANINNTGYRKQEVSGSFAFGDYYNKTSGTVSTSYADFSINESYKTQIGLNSKNGVYIQSRQIINNNSASGNFGSFQFKNANCFWIGGTQFADSARAGIYNKATEVHNWSATGELLLNNQKYGDIKYDRQIYENSNGAYIIAGCQDGKIFYLYRVLYPAIITNAKFSNKLNSDVLSQNYPNPFNTLTTIDYLLEKESNVSIAILNSKGQTIEQLVSQKQSAGKHQVAFNSKYLAPGVYYYRIETELFSETKKMIKRK